MKKVEIYFLINLGAILSIFAIEGELGEYMRRQDDILLEVAKDKLESMVSIENINSLNSDSLYKFTFNLDGEYEDNSANVEANFTLNDTSASDVQYSVSSKAVEKEGSYVAEIPLSDFDVYQNKRFDVELIIGFKPEISNLTMNNWASVFGSEKIATKIEKNISDKVRREGSFKISRKLDAFITPVPLEGQRTDFFVLFDKKRYTVLKGLKWEVPITVGGVYSNKDFEISVTSGKDMVANLEQGTPRSMLIGTSTNTGGAIEVSGIRKSDSKVVTSKARIVVIEPKWASDQDIAEIYTNEKYNFDMRVKSLSRDRVAIRFSSTFGDKNKIIEKSSMSVGPYKKSGKLTFETLVDGTPLKDLTHVVQVKTLPAPSVDFKRKPNTNELTLEVVTYGKSNAVDKLFPIEYNELNFEEYQEYMTLVLQILNKLSFDIDFDRNWIVILQNIVDKQKKDVVNSLKPTWFRNDKFYVIDKKFCTTNTEVLDWKYQLAVRNIIFSKYLFDVENVYDFGSGSGINIYLINQLFENIKLHASDSSKVSVEILEELNNYLGINVDYDMIDIKNKINIDIEPNSAVITTSALEQVGGDIDSFIDFVLEKKPKRVINIEPILEFSHNNEFDNLMKLYCEKRNYLKYYYSKLLQLERENKIKILFKKRTRVGGLFIENSVIVWEVL